MARAADAYIDRFDALVSERRVWEREWREISHYIRPVRQEFRNEYSATPLPEKTHAMIVDSTGFMGMENLQGGLYGFLSNPANMWFELETPDYDLNRFDPVKRWLSASTRIMHKSLQPGFSPFYSQAPDMYGDVSGFGTGVFFSEWRADKPAIYDAAYDPFTCYLDVNNYNEVDTVYRPFWFTGRQAVQQWGEAAVHAKMLKRARSAPGERFKFVHVVHPSEDFVPGTLGETGFPFTDVYVDVENRHIVEHGGRHEFGYQAARWSGRQKYGFGIGRRQLADVKMINTMDRHVIKAAEWVTNPSILMADEESLHSAQPVPRKPVIGGIDMFGRRTVDLMQPTGNLPFAQADLQARREQAKDGFYFALLQLVGRTGITPEEHLDRMQERMRLMGQNLARIQKEFLEPMITQRFSMLWRHGQIPAPPGELSEADVAIKYTSPMAKAQRAAEAQGVMRLMDSTVAMMNINVAAGDGFDTDMAQRFLQDGFGAPSEVLRDPRAVEALRRQRAEAEQAQQALAAAQQGAQALRDATQAAVPRGGAANG